MKLTVNDHGYELRCDVGTTLAEALRDELSLTGTKIACGEGHCGACTVLVDGNAVQSCDTPLWSAAGRSITTIEGLGSAERPHPLQQAFLDEQAAQCGYCINGIMMSAEALLRKNRNPSDAEIAAGVTPLKNPNGTNDNNTVVPLLFDKLFPDWFAGVAYAAIGIGALVPAAIMSIAAANLFTRNVYREYLRRDATPSQEATVSKVTSLLVKVGALVFVVFVDLLAVDRQPHVTLGDGPGFRLFQRGGHADAPVSSGSWSSAAVTFLGDCAVHRSRNSWRKYLIPLVIGLVAPSPSAQDARPRMLAQTSSRVSTSVGVPSWCNIRSRICSSQ